MAGKLVKLLSEEPFIFGQSAFDPNTIHEWMPRFMDGTYKKLREASDNLRATDTRIERKPECIPSDWIGICLRDHQPSLVCTIQCRDMTAVLRLVGSYLRRRLVISRLVKPEAVAEIQNPDATIDLFCKQICNIGQQVGLKLDDSAPEQMS